MWPPSPALAADTVVPLANVAVFFLIQSVFFWIIGTKEVLHVVKDKSRILSQARACMRRSGQDVVAQAIDTAVLDRTSPSVRVAETSAADAEESIAKSGWDPDVEQRTGNAVNLELMRRWVGPWIVGVITLMLVFLVIAVLGGTRTHGRAMHHFHRGHAAGLLLILLGYTGELLLFFFVIKKYTMVGDYELMRTILGLRPRLE